MSLRIRRGTDAQRALTPLDMGELVYTTDTRQLYVGNGIDAGGSPIIRLGTGLAWADAQCTTIIATGAALQVSADTAPTLGGDLTLGGNDITGTGDINITGNITAVGNISSNSSVTNNLITSNLVTTDSNIIGIRLLTQQNNGFDLSVFKGTLLAPTTMAAGDNLGQITIRGYNGLNYESLSVAMNGALEATATIGDLFPKSILRFFVGAGGEDVVAATFNSNGVLSVPVSTTTVYSVAGTALPSAVIVGEGARAFVSDATSNTFAAAYAGSGSFKVPVYSDGTGWFIG